LLSKYRTLSIALTVGIIALVIGIIAFTLSWNIWGGGMPGYKLFLLPGNLTLIYIWHPLFTEEIDFWPKLMLLFLGQFVVVACITAIITSMLKK
jgi:hypothetical protein